MHRHRVNRITALIAATMIGQVACRSDTTASPGRPNLAFARLTAGGSHTCGLTTGGVAYCWGSNVFGQLGATTYAPKPVAVSGGLTFAGLTAGADHTCGLTSDGTAYCWGVNGSGQVGDGSTTQRSAPVAVAGGLTFSSLSAGFGHTCGLTSGGSAFCWGNNNVFAGVLGDGSTTNRTAPVAVSGGLKFASLTAHDHTCGLTSSGTAYCWGDNFHGQLGDGSTTSRTTPVAVSGGLTLATLTAGYGHTCGLTSAGAAYCWGDNSDGQFGDGSYTSRTTPVAASGGLTFASLAGGYGHTCGLTGAGAARCWGYNASGQLGDGYNGYGLGPGSITYNRNTPVVVVGGLTFTSLTTSNKFTCGVASSGAAYCWGFNLSGQLGDGTGTDRLIPVAVVNP